LLASVIGKSGVDDLESVPGIDFKNALVHVQQLADVLQIAVS